VTVVGGSRDASQLVFFSQFILLSQISGILRDWLDPPVIVDKELQGQMIVSKHHRVEVREMVPSKVNSHLAFAVSHGLGVLLYNLAVAPHRLGLQYKSRVPLPDVLVDDQHLKVSVWSRMVRGCGSKSREWQGLRFDNSVVC
jgi:hypothetical protein